MMIKVTSYPTYEYLVVFGNKPAADAFQVELEKNTDVFYVKRRKNLEVAFRMDSESEGKMLARDFERRWLAEKLTQEQVAKNTKIETKVKSASVEETQEIE